MTASRQQCAQAQVFLTLYKQAVQTLRQSAYNYTDWRAYFTFRDRFVDIRQKTSTEKLKQIILNPSLQQKLKTLDVDTLKNIEYMRFNYYVFLKYLPEYQTFDVKSGAKGLIGILKKGNERLRAEVDGRNKKE